MHELTQFLAGPLPIIPLDTGWASHRRAVLAEATRIQAIPAPTFHEQDRARYVFQRFAEIGLNEVRQDELSSVYASTPGADTSAPRLLVSAHLDTVFGQDTDLTIRRDTQEKRIYGPGIGDNSLGLAAMIWLAGQIQERGIVPQSSIQWVATVCEEGLGNLDGMRNATRELGDQIGMAVILEGIGLGKVYHAGLGVRRIRITANGPGGHSWLHADRPSAIHHLIRIGAALLNQVKTTSSPQSTLNIGLISGGISINTRAPEASMALDLRSEDADTLKRMERSVYRIADKMSRNTEIAVSCELIGSRPSASLPVDHPLVQASRAVLRHTGTPPSKPGIGSTDANILLANEIPSVCIGLTTGGDAHSTGEFIETGPLAKGLKQLMLLVLLAAHHTGEWHTWHISHQEA
jgi:tripeptide aminopeptidase